MGNKEKQAHKRELQSELNKRYYQKKVTDKEFKAKDNKKRVARRNRFINSLTDEEKKAREESERKRIANYRKKCKKAMTKKKIDETFRNTLYKRNQSYGKALHKAERSLPSSLERKGL